MARPKYDLVIEAVHYAPDGSVDWVRGYERRGATFSDRKVWKREALIEALRQGRRAVVGRRKTYWGNDFEISKTLRLAGSNGGTVLTTRSDQPQRDDLEDLPRL